MIKRHLETIINGKLFKGKAIILIGARQVGKSTLLSQIVENAAGHKAVFLNCDEPEIKEMLTNANFNELKMIVADNEIMVIDEAQRVPDIGMTLKRITDNFHDLQLLVSGSSSFELQNKLDEPLTGRKFEYKLFPFSTGELLDTNGLIYIKQTLESRLVFGSYPDVVNHKEDAKEILMNIASSYLYKDILTLDNIRKPAVLDKLLVALALQVGSEVSFNEIAQTIGTDSKTVEKYIDLLEKCYIVFKLPALSRNVRNEIKKGKKIFFYDNGIRNAVLQNFAPLNLRSDAGALWENFFISERIKYNNNKLNYVKSYFWRTTEQNEIDYIEEQDGVFTAFEMKYNPKKQLTAKIPETFSKNYNITSSAILTPNNYTEYL
ncbi:MAG: ATP-binding protein [Bacteroidales bacterium]|nr:ATP-binding protein [Bacteroidales bacterium]